ncbi:hypothetical protein Hanom_Chr06g00572731 [Helianthus anomalus]
MLSSSLLLQNDHMNRTCDVTMSDTAGPTISVTISCTKFLKISLSNSTTKSVVNSVDNNRHMLLPISHSQSVALVAVAAATVG